MPDVDVQRLLEATLRRSRQLRNRRQLFAAGIAVAVAAAVAIPAAVISGGSARHAVIVSPGPTTSSTSTGSTSVPPPGPTGTVTVPAVVGQTYIPTAQMALADAGLTAQYQLEHSGAVTAGTVASQTPVAGSRVPSGSTVTVVVSTGPANIPGAQPCQAPALKVQPGQLVSEATGQHTIDWSLTNLGNPCVLSGYPAITALDQQGQVLKFTYSHSGDQMTTAATPQPVYLPTGSSAWIRLNKYRCDVTIQDTTTSIKFALPSGGGTLDLSGLTRRFDYCAEPQSSTVAVSPFEPVEMMLSANP